MKKLATSSLLLAACLCVFVVSSVVADEKAPAKPGVEAGAGNKMTHKAPVLWPAGAIQWAEDPDMKGTYLAALWGDPKKGAYGTLEKWAAGTEVKLHTHSHDVKGVIVSGTLTLTLDGKTTELGPGSYLFMPGWHPHSTKCSPGADCIFFAEQPGMADTKPLEAAATKK